MVALPQTIRTYCTLCGVGCPSAITVQGSKVLKLEPDREHPDGGAVCAKGRAAPEIHESGHRVNYPLIRTRPKTDPDPGWRRASWDEALAFAAERLSTIRRESGPQAVAFGRGTGSGTGLSPTEPWVARLAGAFGSPNYLTNTHLCNWARDGTLHYTFGVYGLPLPEVAKSGCIVLWGSDPTATLLNLATSIVAARAKGARLVVVDPRRVGLANKADLHLAVRPGTDGALALAFIHELIEHRWYDDGFVREWTNAPLLVREDTGRLLVPEDLPPGSITPVTGDGSGPRYVALAGSGERLVEYSAAVGRYALPPDALELRGSALVELRDGTHVRCRTVFDLLADEARRSEPATAAAITAVPEARIREAARFMAEHRPVSHHTWNGIMQHTNATQGGRAIAIFYALLGDWDRPGGNVLPGAGRTRPVSLSVTAAQSALRLGRAERPLGPQVAPPQNIVAYDLYTAVLEGRPYRVRGLVSIGGNTIINTGDPLTGRRALQQLEFFVQAELFHTPTSKFADVLLPAASFLESELLVVRHGHVQRRRKVVEPLHERRPDVEIIFDLACRLGLGAHFAGGDVAAAYDEVLEPLGLSWEAMRDHPHGVSGVAPAGYEKHAETDENGVARGFDTPSRKVELFLDSWAAHGQDPLPVFREPAESPRSTPELARDYPLVLTNAKKPQYLHSQHRGIAALRRTDPFPTAEMHPDTAERYGIADGAWVVIETPRGRARAKAEVTGTILPGVVCAYHGWWEGCEELGLDATDPYDERGTNINLLVHNDLRDPISGAVPHRSALCRVRPIDEPAGVTPSEASA
ncbi:MAG TPA: molybdopterin-dependent oxidoreductase [Candidatus Limnocylindria bacterium]